MDSSGHRLTAGKAVSAVRSVGRWFGVEGRPLMGWLSMPETEGSESGVVILPPVGYPYLCAHHTLRVLGESLARQGHTVLRVDYDGTGDSAGDQWDPDRIAAWRDTARLAVEELRKIGCRRITLIGTRLGGTFALLDGGSLHAERIVAWAPVVSGRRYAKELRMMSTPVPAEHDSLDPQGTIVSAGNVFSAQTLDELRALAISSLSIPPAALTLIVDDPAGSAASAVEHLQSIGARVEHVRLSGGDAALETRRSSPSCPRRSSTRSVRSSAPRSLRAWQRHLYRDRRD
jgi:pimeloyl-ACP methyl ester carboxylesterase